MKKYIKIYCGESIQKFCVTEIHPVKEVERANGLVNSELNITAYSNNADFISAIKYIGLKQGIEAEFFLDGVSYGNSIEEIFADFNRALDMIKELGITQSKEYKISTIRDINGVYIKEGDVINADGYNSDIISEEFYLHCVEFDHETNTFGSNVYGDFDPLGSYKTIEIIAHAEQFRHLIGTDKWGGNLGEVLKD